MTTLASGSELTITGHLLRGATDGPTIGLISGLHGDEFFTAELFRHFLEHIDEGKLRGRLCVVPMANPLGFEWGTRNTPSDMANLNRVFPGRADGMLTEMLADVLATTLFPHCDVLLDYHAEPEPMSIRCTYMRAPDNDYGRKVRALAIASGGPVLYDSPAVPGSIAEYAEARRVPALVVEIGGPLPGCEVYLDEGLRELRNVLIYLGAIAGRIAPVDCQYVVTQVRHVRARSGGLFHPGVAFARTAEIVDDTDVLGWIRSPYTFDEIEAVRPPFRRNVMMSLRGRLSKVHPGDPLYIIGDAESAEIIRTTSGGNEHGTRSHSTR